MDKEKKAKQIFESFQRLKSLQQFTSGIDMEKAKELAFMKRNKNYKYIMGYAEATWRAFLNQPELQDIKVSKADRLVKIYETYIVKLGLKEEDVNGIDSNILLRLSTIVDKKNVEEWLHKAQTLSRADLYRELKYGDVDEAKCKHEWFTKEIKTCKKCGYQEFTNKLPAEKFYAK